jgi:hypothetical protein
MLASEHMYREVANLLDAVGQFMSFFEGYVHIPVIQSIQMRVESIRNGLTFHIGQIFRQLAQVREKKRSFHCVATIPWYSLRTTAACLLLVVVATACVLLFS